MARHLFVGPPKASTTQVEKYNAFYRSSKPHIPFGSMGIGSHPFLHVLRVARAQGLEEQATTAYANAHEALAQAREAWALARDKQENLAFLGDIVSEVSEVLGEERDLAGQMLVEVEALRVEADQFREIARTYQVRISDLVYSQAEAQEHAAYSQGRAAEARKDKLYAEDWVKETRRKRQKEYRQAAADAEEKSSATI